MVQDTSATAYSPATICSRSRPTRPRWKCRLTSAGVRWPKSRVATGDAVPVGAVVAVLADSAEAAAAHKLAAPALRSLAPAQAGDPEWATAGSSPARGRADRALLSPHQAPSRWTCSAKCAHPERNLRSGAHRRHLSVTPCWRVAWPARIGIDLSRINGSGPHGRIVARDVESAGEKDAHDSAGVRPLRVRRPGALSRYAVRRGAARRHAQDHRRAADAGEADHPAFLSDRRCQHRCPAESTRRCQCRRAETSGRAGLSRFPSTISSSRLWRWH